MNIALEQFAVSHSILDGLPLIAVIDMRLRDYEPKSATPWVLTVSTQYATDANGLPSDDEIPALDSWQDEVMRQIADDGIFAGRVTWNGRRELIYYMRSPEPTIPSLRALIAANFRWSEFTYELDEAWLLIGTYYNSSTV